MKCKSCKTELSVIPAEALATFTYCPYCGRELRKKEVNIKIPEPRQLRSGKWNIELKKENVSATFETYEEARNWALGIRSGFIAVEEKKPKTAPVLISSIVEKYISDNENLLSPSTIRAYKSYSEHHFQALMQLDAHSEINYQKHIDTEAKGSNPKTVINSWRLITAAMTAAGIEIPNAKNLHLPKKIKHEKQFLDYEQIETFLKGIEGKDCELAALLALHSLRLSELLAITPNKVDLKKEVIHVRGAVIVGENGLVDTQKNKTYGSTRDVPIMIPRLKELLKNIDSNTMKEYGRKRPYDHINKVCRDCGLPEVGVHGLRHSFASLAYHLGWSEKTTMQVGGWSNTTTVHEIYTHLASQDVNDDIQAMKNFYNGDYKHTVINGRTEEGEHEEIANEITNE